MTRSSELKAINCTSCGAGLDVLGGGRVIVHICPYCGSELDAQDDYRMVRQITKMKRPESPFSIGMTGRLFGVDHTIIGTLGMKEEWGGNSWRWVEHQLYSPTHGYAWLSVEDGHLVFSRRYRGSVWMSILSIETSENRPSVRARDRTYKYYETSFNQITFAEGEFTWAPNWKEQTTSVSALSEDEMLDFSQTGSEREIYRSVYLQRQDVEEAFGISLDIHATDRHPLQPFKHGPNFHFLRNTGVAFAVICLLLATFFSYRSGEIALPATRVAIANMPAEIPFDVTQSNKLVRVQVSGDGINNWAFVEMEITDPDDTLLFETGRVVEKYTGDWSDGGRWNDGSNTGSFRFMPEKTGTYTLSMNVTENEIWQDRSDRANSKRRRASSVTVSVVSGLSSGFWLFTLALGFGAIGGYQLLRKLWDNHTRWAKSDWTDED